MNPKQHANAFVGLSTGTVTAFLLYEMNKRLGVHLDGQETAFVSVAVSAIFLFAGRKLGKQAPPA